MCFKLTITYMYPSFVLPSKCSRVQIVRWEGNLRLKERKDDRPWVRGVRYWRPRGTFTLLLLAVHVLQHRTRQQVPAREVAELSGPLQFQRLRPWDPQGEVPFFIQFSLYFMIKQSMKLRFHFRRWVSSTCRTTSAKQPLAITFITRGGERTERN